MSSAFLREMCRLEDEAFSYFQLSRLCPLCQFYRPLDVSGTAYVLVSQQDHVWTMSHGEVPVCSWLDVWLGDKLDTQAFRGNFATALAQAHWR